MKTMKFQTGFASTKIANGLSKAWLIGTVSLLAWAGSAHGTCLGKAKGITYQYQHGYRYEVQGGYMQCQGIQWVRYYYAAPQPDEIIQQYAAPHQEQPQSGFGSHWTDQLEDTTSAFWAHAL